MSKIPTIEQIDIKNVYNFIKGNKDLEETTEKYRKKKNQLIKEIQSNLLIDNPKNKKIAETLTKELNVLKAKTFGSVVVSCLFKDKTGRSLANIEYITSLYMLDFDKIDNIDEVWEKLSKDPYVMMMYHSPSGKGIKVCVKYDKNKVRNVGIDIQKNYLKFDLFPWCKNYFNQKYNIEADGQAIDAVRNSFISYDDKAYFNENSNIISVDIENTNKGKSKKIINKTELTSNILDKIYNGLLSNGIKLDYFLSKCFSSPDRYNNWITFGWFLTSFFGENELTIKKYFHLFSSTDSDYDEKISHAKITSLIQSFDPTKRNYKLYFSLMVVWCEKNIGLSLSVEEKKEVKNDDIYSFIRENISIRKERTSEAREITFKVDDGTTYINCENTEMTDDIWYKIRNYIDETFTGNYHVPTIRALILGLNYTEYDKIKDYLEKVITTDDTGLNTLLSFIHTDNDEIKNQYIKNWMLGSFENYFTEKVYKHFLIFAGGQNIGKTTYINQSLLKPFHQLDSVDESFSFTKEKDDLIKMGKNMFVFDDELSASTKRDIEKIKKITSQNKIQVRAAYAYEEKKYERVCSFIGCTNKKEIFDDLSGGSRFFVIDIIKQIDFENQSTILTEKVIDDAWGFMYNEWLNGNTWDKGKYIIDYKEHEIEIERYRTNHTIETVLSELLEPASKDDFQCTTDILENISKYHPAMFNLVINDRKYLGPILDKLGYKKYTNGKKRGYLCKVRYSIHDEEIEGLSDIVKDASDKIDLKRKGK